MQLFNLFLIKKIILITLSKYLLYYLGMNWWAGTTEVIVIDVKPVVYLFVDCVVMCAYL